MVGAREVLPELDILPPQRQRRWTVLLRVLLVIPQYIAMAVLGIAGWVVMVIAWFGALALGRLPVWCAEFLGGCLRYATRVTSYLFLLVDTYPPFQWSPQHHPVSVQLAPGRLNRAAVLFRFILYIPAAFMTAFLGVGWTILAVFFWLTVLILGRMPRPVFDATAAVLRYTMRAQAYLMMLTSAYPKWLFGDRALVAPDPDWQQPVPPRPSSTRPLLLSPGGRALLIVIIVLGVLGYIWQNIGSAVLQNRDLDTDGTPDQIQVVATLWGYHPALNGSVAVAPDTLPF
ncbi:MAG: DUF4389 domain-containing protein [Pseudonocardiales bacterium]|nr:DUF4389 domain-containing protein [Pseudonocardiales bacterium]